MKEKEKDNQLIQEFENELLVELVITNQSLYEQHRKFKFACDNLFSMTRIDYDPLEDLINGYAPTFEELLDLDPYAVRSRSAVITFKNERDKEHTKFIFDMDNECFDYSDDELEFYFLFEENRLFEELSESNHRILMMEKQLGKIIL